MGQTKKGIVYVLLAAVLWGSSGVAAQYIMQNSHITAPWLTMVRLLFSGLILLTLSFMQGERVFRIFTTLADVRRLLLFTFFGALLVQLGHCAIQRRNRHGAPVSVTVDNRRLVCAGAEKAYRRVCFCRYFYLAGRHVFAGDAR